MGKATGVPEHALSADAKRLREEKRLQNLSKFEIDMAYGDQGPVKKLIRGDGYGTSRSAGAQRAGDVEANRIWNEEDKNVGESWADPRTRQAMREAASEERREARGKKAGGKVSSASSRGDGIAQRGKTRGMLK